MATGHPRDRAGRVLPASDWPLDRTAPGELEFVRRFINTTNVESGADRLDSVDGLDHWLISQDQRPIRAGPRDRRRLAETREALRACAVAHRDRRSDHHALAHLAATLTVPLSLRADRTGLGLGPANPGGLDAVLARIAAAVVRAEIDGTWLRLKACAHCQWAVYDASKNRAARWCSMSACGGRHKTRTYRARSTTDDG